MSQKYLPLAFRYITQKDIHTITDNVIQYESFLSSCGKSHNHNLLQWRHNDHDGVSNHEPYDCLLNRLFRRRSKKTSKLRVTGLCARNSPVTGEFPAQRASYAENVSIWWRHHVWKDHVRQDIKEFEFGPLISNFDAYHFKTVHFCWADVVRCMELSWNPDIRRIYKAEKTKYLEISTSFKLSNKHSFSGFWSMEYQSV